MRVDELWSDESGAAVLFVVIVIIVIFGMVVLVVDVGGLLLLRGRVVTAADSASLAAAQSCASAQPDDAQAEADGVALANLSGVAGVSGSGINAPTCGDGSGTVSVTYSGIQDLYFAPVLGFEGQHPVSGSATAMWGPSSTAEPIPIALSHACSGPPLWLPATCAYWFDPDNSLDDGIYPSTFGFVHLGAWNRFAGAQSNCPNNSPPALAGWIDGSRTVKVKLREPAPSFVCVVEPGSDQDWVPALESQLTRSRSFAVADSNQETGAEHFAVLGFSPLTIQGLSQGVGEQDVVCGEPIEVEDVVEDQVIDLTLQVLACLLEFGLTGVEIEVAPEGLDYEFDPLTNTFTWLDEAVDSITITIAGTQPADGGECGEPVPDEDAWCLVVSFEGPKVGGTEPNTSAPDFGLRAIRLTQDG